ncbi:MAG: FAD-dependent oxidoreductase [Christensenella sp.]|uniref:oxidoreductase n=1 Tax=Christensenella sp. TaxID=1935934 RepID=UPI002B1FE3E9|nr:FAD-dependent oxidoreductase [Christensenella sp.]MEA5004080.1 FAD-dependent oxidoreductase [Christensenella sp.]
MQTRNDFKHLLSPFTMGKVTFKNRFVFLPHHTGYAIDEGYLENGLFSDRNVRHYVERAKGGAAAVTVSQNVDPNSQMSFKYVLGFEPRNKDNFKRLADEVHEYGCKAITQLNQGGHTTLLNPPQLLVAPTQMNEPYCHFNTKELEKEDMELIKEYYINSAAWQKELGWDAVELKIAHDGLLRTFVSPFFNRREDEYGGSFENRMRYPLEVIAGIREAVGPDYPIGIRLCVDEFTWYGYSLEYGMKIAKALEEGGVDYLSTDAGTFSSWYMQIPPSPLPLGWAVYESAELKKNVDIPITAFGRINDPVQAETILAEGNADLIGMCRQLLCDPETPNKTMEDRLDDIRHCIGCNEGCVGVDGIYVECIQNPAVSREKHFGIDTLDTAEVKKKIMVVGAGVAGLKVAEIAAKRGHNVQVYEKDGVAGGQVRLAEKLPYRNELEEVYRYLRIQLQELGVAVHYDTEVDEALVEQLSPEVLVVATGSTPLMPEFEGLETAKMAVMDVHEALRNVEKIGNNVLVYDDIGFWQGGGVADYCQALGAQVTVVTPSASVGVDIESGQLYLLNKRLYENGADIIANHAILRFEGADVVLENVYNHEEMRLAGMDTVLIAGQSRSENALYKAFKGKRPEVYSAGDCVAPRAIEQAILEAEVLARRI